MSEASLPHDIEQGAIRRAAHLEGGDQHTALLFEEREAHRADVTVVPVECELHVGRDAPVKEVCEACPSCCGGFE